MTPPAIVFFAHGSRDPLWRAPIEAIAQRTRALAPLRPVRCAYLELSLPDLPTSVAELVAQGISRITVVPLFLGVGKHAREDLPVLMDALQAQFAQVRFDLQPAIGENGKLVDLIAHIALADQDTEPHGPIAS